jgi:hypothetical protein
MYKKSKFCRMEEEKVRYKLLGKTGLKVSEIGFGGE